MVLDKEPNNALRVEHVLMYLGDLVSISFILIPNY